MCEATGFLEHKGHLNSHLEFANRPISLYQAASSRVILRIINCLPFVNKSKRITPRKIPPYNLQSDGCWLPRHCSGSVVKWCTHVSLQEAIRLNVVPKASSQQLGLLFRCAYLLFVQVMVTFSNYLMDRKSTLSPFRCSTVVAYINCFPPTFSPRQTVGVPILKIVSNWLVQLVDVHSWQILRPPLQIYVVLGCLTEVCATLYQKWCYLEATRPFSPPSLDIYNQQFI